MQATLEQIKLNHNRIIEVANFQSLTSTKSDNEKLDYEQFLTKLSKAKVTSEKGNAGGFIGGYVHDSRKKENVKSRSLITIDVDEVPRGLNMWENIEGFTNFAVAMYSTHSHTKEDPRYRVIIPLLNDITPEQYQEVTQYLVGILQIDIDEGSFQHERHMHYPTCSNPSMYEFYYQDLPFFDADFIVKQNESIEAYKNDKKADPRTKQNWIGAWTSIYSITDVLEMFLPDVYEPFNTDRYTFTDGSTKGGLVVYDDNTHAQSNHSTDPISGKNVNSFDLYRLHKFGHLDTGKVEKITDMPSYKAMIQHCQQDEKVKAHYEENIQFELYIDVKDSSTIDLQKALTARRFEELEKINAEILGNWDGKGKEPKKVTALTPVRCALILPEYISFILFDFEENTRLSMYQPSEGVYTRNATLIKRVISWLEPNLISARADDVIYFLTNTANKRDKTESRYLIPVQNGVFNLKTKKLEPFSSDYVFTTKISTVYNPNASNLVIDGWNVEDWLSSIACGDQEIIHLLWQVMNDSLNGNYTRKKAIFLVGDGNNGKGTLQELIINLIGVQNIASLKVNEFDEEFKISALEGKTAVIGDDVPVNVYIDDSSNFNSVVTGDRVTVNVKNKPLYTTAFKCSVIQSTNGMPKFRNKTQGTLRRIVIVPFNADFNGKVENFKIKDEYIRNEEVLQYVLHKAIHMDFERFAIPAASNRELEVFQQDNDPILDFKLSVFDEWKIPEVPKYVVYGFYKQFCKDNGYKHVADRQFHKQLKVHLGSKWEDSRNRFNYETLIKPLGDLDEMYIGFPDQTKVQRTYKRVTE